MLAAVVYGKSKLTAVRQILSFAFKCSSSKYAVIDVKETNKGHILVRNQCKVVLLLKSIFTEWMLEPLAH